MTGDGGIVLDGTTGQPDAGLMSNGATSLLGGFWPLPEPVAVCYANCDGSTFPPILNANDFLCFLNRYAADDVTYANCDNSTFPPLLNANDFNCFLNKYAAGCS